LRGNGVVRNTIVASATTTHTNAKTIADVNPNPTVVNNRTGTPRTFGIGAPRTVLVTLGTKF
jgi:hypothetical protein